MALIGTPHVKIEYEEYGRPGGLSVILLHGFPDSLRTWDSVVSDLHQDASLRIIVPSLRAFGNTHVHDPNAVSGQGAALAQDVLDLADALKIDKFVLVGHDWGARASYAVGVLAPQRLLGFVTLSSPYVAYGGKKEKPELIRAYWYQWYFNTEHGRQGFETNPIPLCEYLWPAWSPKWKFTQVELDTAKSAWNNPQFAPLVISYYRHRYNNAPGAPAYAKQQALLDPKPGGQLPRVEVPLLYGCGLADAVGLPEASLGQEAWFPGGYERVEFPNVGHFPQRESPHEVANLIRRAIPAH